MDELTTKSSWDAGWKMWARRRGLGITMRLFHHEFDALLRRVFARVPQGGRMLELGGAPGSMAVRGAALRPDLQLDCLDYSDDGVQRTREVYARHGIRGEIIHGDFREGGERFGQYDLVASYGLVEHFEDTAEVIALHLRYAKPGGWVLITVPDLAHAPIHALLRRCALSMLERHNLSAMDPARLRACVAQAGGVEIACGSLGAATLPNSRVDATLAGRAYEQASRAWNLGVSLVALLSGYRLTPRFWDTHLYVLARRAPGA